MNMLRTRDEKKVFLGEKTRFATALDLMKFLKQIK